jgi:hypothetical protein
LNLTRVSITLARKADHSPQKAAVAVAELIGTPAGCRLSFHGIKKEFYCFRRLVFHARECDIDD